MRYEHIQNERTSSVNEVRTDLDHRRSGGRGMQRCDASQGMMGRVERVRVSSVKNTQKTQVRDAR